MIPFWILGLLTMLTVYLYVVSCTPQSPVKKHLSKFKTWCRDKWHRSAMDYHE